MTARNSISVKNLTFRYSNVSRCDQSINPKVIDNISFELVSGSRCLLLGVNGCGKSTLLRILSGRHLYNEQESFVSVAGMNPYRDHRANVEIAYLDCDWGLKNVAFGGTVPMLADIPVHGMMTSLQNAYPERRDELIKMLKIDPNWRMNKLSDGQRRRVQLLINLVRPFNILLLDEVTTSLDVCVRQDLLKWIEKETKERKCTVIYATHIFDGLDDWPTHLMYITKKGTCGWCGELENHEYYQELKTIHHPCKMLAVAERWLRKDHEVEDEAGPNVHENDPTKRHGGYASGTIDSKTLTPNT